MISTWRGRKALRRRRTPRDETAERPPLRRRRQSPRARPALPARDHGITALLAAEGAAAGARVPHHHSRPPRLRAVPQAPPGIHDRDLSRQREGSGRGDRPCGSAADLRGSFSRRTDRPRVRRPLRLARATDDSAEPAALQRSRDRARALLERVAALPPPPQRTFAPRDSVPDEAQRPGAHAAIHAALSVDRPG